MSYLLSSRVAEEAPDSQRQAGDLAAFRRMLQVSGGTFSLSFAICDNRPLRDSLVKRFSEETPGILVVTLPAGVESVLRYLESQITDKQPTAVFILDIEASIPFGSDNQPTLRVLNASRERWEKLRCPVVFWLAEYAITLLHTHAPDLWRYRSHQFEFVPEPVPLDQLKEEVFSGVPMVDALPFEEKAFRTTELERRIREAGDPPSAELLPHVLKWIYELAYLYRHASRYQESEAYLRLASDLAQKAYGPEHFQTAVAFNDLAALLQDTNRLAEAETLMRRALEIDEASYGPGHPAVARDINNLASLLQATNRLAEAEPLVQRALQIDEASYGPEHPNVANRLNNLASLLQATNRLAEAEPLMRRGVVIEESSKGPLHPHVAIQLNNLAQMLHATNRLEEAEPLMRRALQISEASYGLEHPTVATRLNNLALLLKDTNRLAEAEPLMCRTLGICMRSLGWQHPNSQAAVNNYTALLRHLELPQEEILQRVKMALEG